jgi:very-short-patch-repair endonuclease
MVEKPEPRRGPRPGRRWTRVGHGLYRPTQDISRFHDELLAWRLVLPATGMFTHLTAAREYGWWLPPLPEELPIFVDMSQDDSRPQRKGIEVTRLAHAPPPFLLDGIPLAPPAETLLACARDLRLLDLVVLVDAALHSGSCSEADLEALSRQRRRGAPMLRRALRLADGRSESAWESMLRMLHSACKVPVQAQHEVYDEHGGFVARGDLLIEGTRTLHEYDGDHHLSRSRQRQDLARQRRLGNAGWVRRGYTAYEVIRQPTTVLRDADASMGRPHRPERVRRWRDLLSDSLFTASGQWGLRTRLLGS